MKNKIIFLVSVLMLSISIMAQTKPLNAEENNATNILILNNRIVDIRRNFKSATNQYNLILDKAESNIKELKNASENNSITIYAINYKTFEASFANLDRYKKAYKKTSSFAGKEQMNKFVNNANEDCKQSVKWAEAMSKYFSKKEFRTDSNLKKYNSIKGNLNSFFTKAKLELDEAYKLIEKEADKAELLLLQKNQIADFIIPMKDDYNGLKSIIGLLNEDELDTKKTLDELTTLSSSLNLNKDISNKDITKLKEEQYKDVYLTFYEKSEATVEAIKAYTLEVEVDPYSENLDALYSNININYDAVIAAFNSFKSQL